MNKIKIFGVIFPLLLITLGCEKNEQDKSFRDVNRIGIGGDPLEYATTDSLLFSFAVYPVSTVDAQVSIIAKISGEVSTADRQFKMEVDESRSTALAAEYQLPAAFVVKAGSTEARVPVTLKRSSRLENRTVKLSLKIVGNENFQPATKSVYNLVWTDELIKPFPWDGAGQIGTTFGKYSKVKHRLLVDATEYKNLQVLTGNYNILFYIASRALDNLAAYNAAHPGNPLKTEDGMIVNICNNCE